MCAILLEHAPLWTLSGFPLGIKAQQTVNAAGEVCLSLNTEKRHKHKTSRLLQGPVQLSRATNLCNPLSSRRSVRMTEPILFTTARQWYGRSLASRPRINTPALWEKRERVSEHETEKAGGSDTTFCEGSCHILALLLVGPPPEWSSNGPFPLLGIGSTQLNLTHLVSIAGFPLPPQCCHSYTTWQWRHLQCDIHWNVFIFIKTTSLHALNWQIK